MSEVVSFPAREARRHTKRARLAAYLRDLAARIEADEVEVEPVAALIVVTGRQEHEVVCCGYGDDGWGLVEAAEAAGRVTRNYDFKTMGGNRRRRGDYIPRPLRHQNIVDGDFPRPARPSQPEPSR